ncbi:hypothetical protein, partial [Rhizobium anhuiense]
EKPAQFRVEINSRDARQTNVHAYNGEFVDDLKVSLDTRHTTRFIHAKSGPNVYWKRNLVRDFKSQSARIPKGTDVRLELWLTSQERKDALVASLPQKMPSIKFVVWRDQWPSTEPWTIPRLSRCLRHLVHQRSSEMLLENAWNAIKSAHVSGKHTSVERILRTAHVATLGAVNSLEDANPDLLKLFPKFQKVKGLTFAIDGGTLLFWNSDTIGAYSQDIRRVSWSQVKARLEKGPPLRTMSDFYHLLGGV